MPQLDIATFPMQLFWLAVTFGLLLILMAKVALPRVGGILEERNRRIDADLAAAKAARDKAEALMAEYEKTLANARSEAQSVMKSVLDAVTAESQKRETALAQKLSAQTADAEQRIRAAKDAALANVREIAAAVAVAATQKLLGEAVAESEAKAAVEKAAATAGGRA